MEGAFGRFVVAVDAVAVLSGGQIDLVRPTGEWSCGALRSRDGMLLALLGHFEAPATRDSWEARWPAPERERARALFDSLHTKGFVVSTDDGPPATAAVHPESADAVLQSLCALVPRLRAAMAVEAASGGPRTRGAAETAAVLHACHRVLLRLNSEVARAQETDRRMRLDAAVASARAASEDGAVRLHVGCGPHRLRGWINVDLLGGDIALDIRDGLPVADGTFSALYLGHLLEHLDYKDEALVTLRELRRVARSGCVLRVVVPDIGAFARAYAADDITFFRTFERLWDRPPSDSALASFLHYAGAGAFPHVMDRHKFGYDSATLLALVAEAGFHDAHVCAPGEGALAGSGVDYSWATHADGNGRAFSLIVEAHA